MVVKVEGLVAPKIVVGLPPQCLPFGFLESVSVLGVGPAVVMPDFRLSITKTTGARASLRTRRTVSCMATELANDNDAADDSYKTLRDATGHNLKFRMVPTSIILTMAIEFYGIPPSDFFIVYHCANAVSVDAVAGARDVLVEHRPLDFLFKPMKPSDRLKLAMDIAKDLDKSAGAGVGAGVGAGSASE
jgi:hypothetical protein